MKQSTYDAHAIEGLLPHRFPFLLVDRIDVIVPGQHVVGLKRLTADEWWADGSIDQTFPFTLALEALAQASGALLSGLTDGADGVIGYFMGADHVRFRNAARVGDALHLDVTLLQWKRSICRAHGVATVDGNVVVTANLTTAIRAAG